VPLPALAVEGAQVLGTLALFAGLTLAPRLLMLFVPAAVARGRAAALARAQFLAHNLHATAERTGILVFVSEAERHAEVIADAGIAARVPQAEWDAIVAELTEAAKGDRLAEGFVRAVERSGALLAEAFPPRPDDRNEIPDRLVEI
jgi:putative membrane protein